MQIIPVIDLLSGVVVRGAGGRRRAYRPMQSLLTADSDPEGVLDAFAGCFGFSTAYVADLDGIISGRPDLRILAELALTPVELIVDGGVKAVEDVETLIDLGVSRVVAATESLSTPTALEDLIKHYSSQRIVFSVDMRGGRPMCVAEDWKSHSPEAIVQRAADLGVTQFILLDLADVGKGEGTRTLALLASLRERFKGCWFAVGGGVRSVEDLHAADRAGADALLVASALHDGRIKKEDLSAFAI